MSQLQATIELTPDLIAAFAALADAPYDVESFSRIAQSHGWSLVPPEDWETRGDPFLRVNVGVDYPNLIALWGAENLAGIPLAVLFDDDATVDVVSDTAISAFNSAFAAAKQLLDAELGISHATRTYDSQHQPFPLSFAHYQRAKSTIALIQHDEGDGHLGNSASLDIRIIPVTSDRIELPLKTNLIF